LPAPCSQPLAPSLGGLNIEHRTIETTPLPRTDPSASDTHPSTRPVSPRARGGRRSIRRRPRPHNRRGRGCGSARRGRCGCATPCGVSKRCLAWKLFGACTSPWMHR